MLRTDTVEPGTLELLRLIQSDKAFDKFCLVGGTNLALRLGHRLSVDLDFFTVDAFNSDDLIEPLDKLSGGNFSVINQTEYSLIAYVHEVRVDFIRHNYPLVANVETIDGARMASIQDVAAMKVNAITKRGAKKDFYDFVELLELYSLDEILGFYSTKYANNDLGFVLRSLVYFDDAENQPAPISLNDKEWESVKAFIVLKVTEYFNK